MIALCTEPELRKTVGGFRRFILEDGCARKMLLIDESLCLPYGFESLWPHPWGIPALDTCVNNHVMGY